MLGGSSSINGMVYIRGQMGRRRLGDLGTTAGATPRCCRRSSATSIGTRPVGVSRRGGPGSNVADLRQQSEISRVFVRAAGEAGYPLSDDFNGAEQEGVGFYQVTQKDGRRCSSARAYLHPIRQRPNLTVITRARRAGCCSRGSGRSEGLISTTVAGRSNWAARREVVLSGGAINSPQLLLPSGVGPRAELEKHGIPLVHELPGVGRNLQDQLLDVIVAHLANGGAPPMASRRRFCRNCYKASANTAATGAAS